MSSISLNHDYIHVTLHEYYCNGKCNSTSIYSPKHCFRIIMHKNKMIDGLPLKDVLIKYFKDYLPYFPSMPIGIESINYTSILNHDRNLSEKIINAIYSKHGLDFNDEVHCQKHINWTNLHTIYFLNSTLDLKSDYIPDL